MVAGTALAGAGAVLVGAQSTLTLPLVVGLRNGLLSVNEVLKQVILFAGILILAAAGAALTPFFAIQLLVGVGAMLAVPFLVDRSQLAWPSLSRADVRHLALVGLPIALAAILTTFYIRMLVVLASLETSNHETGLFVTSARVIEMIGGLALLVVGVILPVATVAARDDRPRLGYVLAHTTKLAMLAGGLLAVVVVVGARPIVVLLGGEEFAGAAAVLRLQGPVVLSTFLVYVWTAFLIADGHRRALVRCMAIGTVALFVSGLTLIAQFDARGAAGAAVVADGVLVVVAGLAARRVGDGRIGIDAEYLARYAIALAGAAGAALAVLAIAPCDRGRHRRRGGLRRRGLRAPDRSLGADVTAAALIRRRERARRGSPPRARAAAAARSGGRARRRAPAAHRGARRGGAVAPSRAATPCRHLRRAGARGRRRGRARAPRRSRRRPRRRRRRGR